MSEFSYNDTLARLENKLRRGAQRVKFIIKKSYSPISILNDDILLHIFYIHRLHIKDDMEDDWYGTGYLSWGRQRWWHKLAHVSQRWRHVILAAPSLLDLHLVCTSGVPVADMLAHLPPLPLTIFYLLNDQTRMKEEDRRGALLALSHHDRVHRIALYMRNWELERLFVGLDGQFPILERLIIKRLDTNFFPSDRPDVTLPRTFGAPNLSHLKLMRVALPIQSPLLTTTGLISLQLRCIPSCGNFPPSYLLTSLSLMPQLEALSIEFIHSFPNPDVWDTESTSHVILPNLREFAFWGSTGYLDGLCAKMAAPVLSVFHIHFFTLRTLTIPHILSFMQTSETFSFHAIKLTYNRDSIHLQGDPQPSGLDPFSLNARFLHFDWDILTGIQIFDALSPLLSAEHVTLCVTHDRPSLGCDVNRTQWRGLLRPFSNVKVLCVVTDDRSHGLGHSLRTEDGEQPLELLSNLEEVRYTEVMYTKVRHSGSGDAFTPFINERKAMGHPVRLTLQSWSFWSWDHSRLIFPS